MSQGKMLFFLVVVAAFLGLGWAYQDAAGDAEKYKNQYNQAASQIKELTEAKEKKDKADTVSDTTTKETIEEKQVVEQKAINIKQRVEKETFKIDKKYENLPQSVENTKEKEDELSSVRITALWDMYNECQDETKSCSTLNGETP